jgi:hypothetical protein
VKIKERFFDVRNSVDFFLRNRLRLGREVKAHLAAPETDWKLQEEFRQFFSRFDWKSLLAPFAQADPLVVADIGARNFAFGPVIDKVFEKAEVTAEIHGIEIDSFRLLSGFHTRKNFGDYYAAQMRKGYFHPTDFLMWNEPLHLALLLNPFVSEEPTLAWGLPLSTLHPERMFRHTFNCLAPQNGLMLLTCPSVEEMEIAKELAKTVGFEELTRQEWHPPKQSVQQKPRYGILYQSRLS